MAAPAESPPIASRVASTPSVAPFLRSQCTTATVSSMRPGEFRFRGQRIVDGDHDDAGARRVLAHDPVVGVDAEKRPATAVQVDECGLERLAARVQCPDADAAVADGNLDIRGPRHLRTALRPVAAHFFRDLARLRQRDLAQRRVLAPVLAHSLHEFADLRVEPVFAVFGHGANPGAGKSAGDPGMVHNGRRAAPERGAITVANGSGLNHWRPRYALILRGKEGDGGIP